ncbi:MAG: hypothetical protein LAT68_04805 [Cyclobacteriaceae bacterium]|nr:hypothetical protein [Cyclobacteriaceae bacterium]MCH8515631.1 hypothetical protein [Cyclobacteriaceae bacterium]
MQLYLFIFQLLFNTLLVGIFFYIQLIAYPIFKSVPQVGLKQYAADYRSKIARISIPLMLPEFVAAVLILFEDNTAHQDFVFFLLFASLVILWLHSFFGIYPVYKRFGKGFDEDLALINQLLWMNALRLLGWLVKLAFMIYFGMKWFFSIAPL